MLPMNLRARQRIHATSGESSDSGADEDVRPVTRRFTPDLEINESVNSGELKICELVLTDSM